MAEPGGIGGKAWSDCAGARNKVETALSEMTATEEFHAYPGLELMAAVHQHITESDAHAAASLARRITRAIRFGRPMGRSEAQLLVWTPTPLFQFTEQRRQD
jgi:hypothetical protein